MLFKVHNTGKGPRYVRTADGRKVSVMPTDADNAKKMDLTPGDARELFRISQFNAKRPSSIVVSAVDDAGREVLTGKKPAEDAGEVSAGSPYDEGDENAPASSQPPSSRPVSPKKALLDEAPTIGLDELRARAKEVLGNDAPKGLDRLKRRDIINALKE